MPFRDTDFLQKARITLYYDQDAKKLLAHCKVEPFDSVSGNDTNTEYYLPFRLNIGILDRLQAPAVVCIEMKKDGAFPSNATKGQAVGTVEIHQYGDL
jgi:hypothetical protein